MESAFAHPVRDVLANFNVKDTSGLSDAEVENLRNKHGRNCTLSSTLIMNRPAPSLNIL